MPSVPSDNFYFPDAWVLRPTDEVIAVFRQWRSEVAALAKGVFSDADVNEAYEKAECLPFEEFAAYVEVLGCPRAHGRAGVEQQTVTANVGGKEAQRPLLYNLALCLRYPFLIPKTSSGDILWVTHASYVMRYGEREQRSPFSVTELGQMSAGWRVRFGLEFCEDFYAALVASEEIEEIPDAVIIELENKFGTLRITYQGPRSALERMSHVKTEYIRLSEIVCEKCGSLNCVRMNLPGWVTPVCLEDVYERYANPPTQEGLESLRLENTPFGNRVLAGDEFSMQVYAQMMAEKRSGVARLDPSLVRCLSDDREALPDSYDLVSVGRSGYPNKVEDTCDYPWNKLCVSKVFSEALNEGLSSRKELILKLMDGGLDDRLVISAVGHFLSNGGRP